MDNVQFIGLLATILIAMSAIGGIIIAQIRALERHNEQRFSGLEDRFSKLEQRFSEVESSVTALETRFSALETRVSTLESHVAALGERVADLSERVSRIEGLFQGLFARMGNGDDV